MDGMTSMNEPARSGGIGYGEDILAWEAPEYATRERGERWYMIAGVCAVSLIAYGLVTAQYTMAIVFALLAAVYHLVHNHPERDVVIRITTLGIVIDDQFYQFSDIASFWIVYDPSGIRKLYIRNRKRFSADMGVELMDQDPMAVRQALERNVSEIVGKSEHGTEKLARWLNL